MKTVALVLLAFAVLFSVASARQFTIGARAMAASDDALSKGDIATAIDEARAAAEARAPASPYPPRAYTRLAALAQSAEQGNNFSDAARAWRAIRSAALATRAFSGDHAEQVREANANLARIGAHARGRDGERASSLELRLAEDLARDERPSVSAYAALGAGGLLFYLGIASFLTGHPRRWSKTLTAALVASGALLATLGCLLS